MGDRNFMPSNSKGISQRIYRFKVARLQKAGLLKNVDPSKKPTSAVFAQFSKHKDILTGQAAIVKAPSKAKARELRKKLGVKGSGDTLIIPREKGERFRVTRKGEIKSTRHVYGQTVHKTIGTRVSVPKAGGKAYYTLPRRKRGQGYLKRTTFSSFDELLFYLNKYEIDFEDVEDYIEVEEFKTGGRRDKQMAAKIAGERQKAVGRLKRKSRAVRRIKRKSVRRAGKKRRH